jgi:C-terminal processing protease CtpA/Prc
MTIHATTPSLTAPPRTTPGIATLFAAAFVCVVAGCGGSGSGDGNGNSPAANRCSDSARKDWVLDTAQGWYLFADLLPASVNTADYASPAALLDFLTATARQEGKDRGFSYLTTRAADQSFFSEGEFVGFGIRTRIDAGTRLLVLDVYEGSPAADAGLARGAAINAIDAGDGYRTISDWLAEDPALETAFGPADEGVMRGMQFTLGAQAFERSLTKRIVTIDPVPPTTGVRTLPLAGTAGVGYVNLRTFISTADSELRNAFDEFRIAGLTDFIMDLRYNGGGLVNTAELLGDLFGAARDPNDVFSKTRFNPARAAANDEIRTFGSETAAVAPVRIAFLTSESSASASEIVINSLDPWAEIAIVGGNTFGKPVGQSAFDLAGCEDRLRLISFRTDNALDQGGYYEGLAPYVTFACAAPDDLDRAQGDPDESMTAAALSWLGAGQCDTLIAAGSAGQTKTALGAARVPFPARPTPAQANLPGLF